MSEELVHVIFRSKETGRYLFHGKWPLELVEFMEKAASELGITVNDFIHQAIDRLVQELNETHNDQGTAG